MAQTSFLISFTYLHVRSILAEHGSEAVVKRVPADALLDLQLG